MLRVTLRRIHLILAFISGLFLINLSISGALLLYAKDIQSIINPQYWTVSENTTNVNSLLDLAEITASIDQKIAFIQPEKDLTKAWQLRLVNGDYLSINPFNNKVLLRYRFSDTLYGFTMYWHRWLLYTNSNDEKPLQLWVASASLILIFELIVGFYLWIRPKNRLKRLKIRWGAKNKVRFMQLHGTIGVIFCIPLILIAFSGIAFYWIDASKQAVEWLSMSKIQQHDFREKVFSPQGNYQLNKAYSAALNALPHGDIYRIYLPKEPNDLLALRLKMPTESHAYSYSWSDPYSGNFIDSFDASSASRATQVWNFKYKFHIGEFIGWPVKVLWLFISLMPSFFAISGIYLWTKRKLN